MDKPSIVCLCGSTRFYEAFLAEAQFQSTQGKIVLMPNIFHHRPDTITVETFDVQQQVELHLEKVKMADIIIIINPGGYFGKHTQVEIELAESLGKPVVYTNSVKQCPK